LISVYFCLFWSIYFTITSQWEDKDTTTKLAGHLKSHLNVNLEEHLMNLIEQPLVQALQETENLIWAGIARGFNKLYKEA
jgi:hypothetical protein